MKLSAEQKAICELLAAGKIEAAGKLMNEYHGGVWIFPVFKPLPSPGYLAHMAYLAGGSY